MSAKFALVFVCLVTLGFASAGAGAAPEEQEMPENRGDRLAELRRAEDAFDLDRGSADARLRYAELLYECGRFEDSREAVLPLLRASEPVLDAMMLDAKLHYLMGEYDEAESALTSVIARAPENVGALRKLAFVYYQTNRYERCAEFSDETLEEIRFAHLDLMLAFEGETPYEASWSGHDYTEVPFIATDPLPILTVEVQGRPIRAIIDTGGNCFILDPEIAEALGIEVKASLEGMFAGGLQAQVGLGIAESMKLGDVTLRRVPIAMLPTMSLSLGGEPIEGIVGTNLLKQFLATIDYPNGRLILRDPSGSGATDFYKHARAAVLGEVPFYLQSTHFLLAHGSLNGRDDLLFHVDSGLAGEPSFGTVRQTLDYVGIPIPDVQVSEEGCGGGGGGIPTGTFAIDELGLGRLVQQDLVGSFGMSPPQSYTMLGFIMDGTVSHGFLRQYAWTLDFSRMRMVFTR